MLTPYPAATSALAEICRHCPHVADTSIELHEGLQGRCCPSRCVGVYFDLVAAVDDMVSHELSLMTGLMRELISIEALDAEESLLETLRFDPSPEETLETYCRRVLGILAPRCFEWVGG